MDLALFDIWDNLDTNPDKSGLKWICVCQAECVSSVDKAALIAETI